MKHINQLVYILLFTLITIPTVFAQSVPQGMKYQAVARDISGNVIADEEITIQIALQSGIESKKVHYMEEHKITTNALGLFSIVIGEGTIIEGDFIKTPWSTEDIWMGIALKDKTDTGFTVVSNSKLLAVPYAYHAATASQLVKDGVLVRPPNDDGVPANVWHTFGNSETDSRLDKLGTTDFVDLVMITNNIERLRITKEGDINIANNLTIGNDLHVEGNTYLDNNVDMNIDGGQTTNNGDFTVANMSKTVLTGTLRVDKATDLKDVLNVDGQTDLNSDVNVNNGSATNLTGTLNVDGTTDLNNHFRVNNGSKSSLTGELAVGGDTFLNSATSSTTPDSGALKVVGGVGIGENLNVAGSASIGGDTNFGGIVTLTNTTNATSTSTGALVVAGGAGIGKNLYVGENIYAPKMFDLNDTNFFVDANGTSDLNYLNVKNNLVVSKFVGIGNWYNNVSLTIQSPAAITYPFYSEVLGTSNLFLMNNDGQLYARSTKAGPSNNTGNYGMLLDAQNQGLIIRLNEKTFPSNSNNYMAFWGSSNIIRGQIRGQNLSEYHNSFDFIWANAMAGLDEAFILAEGVACGFQLDLGEVGVMAAQGALIYAQWAEWYINGENSVGVLYESGSGDYAEWLIRSNQSEKFTFGDIVSVKGGAISKNTSVSNQLMVISMSPIVLGNMPEKGKESMYEKVAFMGQVPVKVIGSVNIGDYIVASGSNDGFGRAIAPDKMKLEDYNQIVGVAWSESVLDGAPSLINVAVGVNHNDLVGQLQQQQEELNSVKSQMSSVVGYLQSKDPNFKAIDGFATQQDGNSPDESTDPILASTAGQSTVMGQSAALTTFKNELRFQKKNDYVNRLINEKPELLIEGINYVRAAFEAKGVDVNAIPELQRLFNDRSYLFETIRKHAMN